MSKFINSFRLLWTSASVNLTWYSC